uniref:Uncharacterized protein n=1 Tax=Arundo donax TaxID=35708 RepID=A0A0A9DJS4_ARUDO
MPAHCPVRQPFNAGGAHGLLIFDHTSLPIDATGTRQRPYLRIRSTPCFKSGASDVLSALND